MRRTKEHKIVPGRGPQRVIAEGSFKQMRELAKRLNRENNPWPDGTKAFIVVHAPWARLGALVQGVGA